ncbi:hypothetical protein C4D60_Mb08t04250 [Musa balbisiana]|uniref:Uncharacterized protein n=1 Tax=Musa balbisiana TaxID=52838 RepID=A0A4S8K1B1_MUSBA|nr:hypothetical protein C4D60_Mb08t04250 [Musa balbisiana]
MSDHVLPEQVCYVNCSFCNTTLLVNVPGSNSSNVVAVRCELCANLLSVNLLETLLGKLPLQSLQQQRSVVFLLPITGSSSKEEIRRLKTKNPNISHKEAFSTAAKNWAHFPEIHCGLSIKGNKQV